MEDQILPSSSGRDASDGKLLAGIPFRGKQVRYQHIDKYKKLREIEPREMLSFST